MARSMDPQVAEARSYALVHHRHHEYGEYRLPYDVHLSGTDLALVMGTMGSRCPTDTDERQASYLHDAIEDAEEGIAQATADLLNAGFRRRVVDIILFCTDESGHETRRERKAATYARMRRQIRETLGLVEPAPALLPVAISGARVKVADRFDNLRAGFRDDDPRILMYLDEHEVFRHAIVEAAPFMRRLLEEYDRLIAHMQCEPPIRQKAAVQYTCGSDFWKHRKVGDIFTFAEGLEWTTVERTANHHGLSIERFQPSDPHYRRHSKGKLRVAQVMGRIRPKFEYIPYILTAQFWGERQVWDMVLYSDSYTASGVKAAARRNGWEVDFCPPDSEPYKKYGMRVMRAVERIRKEAVPCPTCHDTGVNPKATPVGGGLLVHPLGEVGYCADCQDVPRRRGR